MANFTFNGAKLNGGSLSITGGRVIIDGQDVTEDLRGSGALPQGVVEIRILDGVLGELRTDASVNCGEVRGDVTAGGSVNCDEVGGNVSAGGSVNCDDVRGSVTAGGSIRRG